MPVKLSNFASKVAKINIAFDEGDLNVEYYPNLITEETLVHLNGLNKMNQDTISESFKAYNDTLVGLMKSWDLLDDDGETILPLTSEQMIKIGIVVRGAILTGIMSDMRPN